MSSSTECSLFLVSSDCCLQEIGQTTHLLLEEILRCGVYALDALCVLRCEGGDDRGAVAPEGHERLQVCLERRVGQFPSWYDIILLDSNVDCELVTSN